MAQKPETPPRGMEHERPDVSSSWQGSARNLVDGRAFVASTSTGITEDPNTGEPLGEMPAASHQEVEQALASAYRAWDHGNGPVSRLQPSARVAALECLASSLDEHVEDFAYWHARETGIPISTARIFAAGLGAVARGVAEVAPTVLASLDLSDAERRVMLLRLPWGPAALFAPWNAAAFLSVTKLSYAIAAGCPAVLKPSEYAPATTGLVVDALEQSDLAPGTAQVLCGGVEVGAQLAADPRVRMISYTGGTVGGRAVASAGSQRMTALQLELSASNPAIVTRDADPQLAAAELARGALVLNGQWCEAPRRVFVDRSMHDDLVGRLLDEMSNRKLGHALDENTEVGPLAHRIHYESVLSAIERLAPHGEVRTSHDELPAGGFFVSPTVVSALPLDAVDREIFGPVLAVCPYEHVGDALEAANSLDDGLAGYVFAGGRTEAFSLGSRLHAGEVRLGGTRLLDLATGSTQSFWGESGVGGHGRVAVLEAHLGTRIVGEDDLTLAL